MCCSARCSSSSEARVAAHTPYMPAPGTRQAVPALIALVHARSHALAPVLHRCRVSWQMSSVHKAGNVCAQVDTRAQALAEELSDCLVKPGGVACKLMQDMTHSLDDPDQPTTAQQRPQPLHAVAYTFGNVSLEATSDPDGKVVAERFMWEFLVNRTFSGKPSQEKDDNGDAVGCNPASNSCKQEGQVCALLHWLSFKPEIAHSCASAHVHSVLALRWFWRGCQSSCVAQSARRSQLPLNNRMPSEWPQVMLCRRCASIVILDALIVLSASCS